MGQSLENLMDYMSGCPETWGVGLCQGIIHPVTLHTHPHPDPRFSSLTNEEAMHYLASMFVCNFDILGSYFLHNRDK